MKMDSSEETDIAGKGACEKAIETIDVPKVELREIKRITVFISYSRKDINFANRLQQALMDRGIDVKIDKENIESGEDWWVRIQQLILESDNVIFTISPDSVISKICRDEVDFAEHLKKRLIPVVAREVSTGDVPPALARLNYIFFTPNPTAGASGEFEVAVDELAHTIETDIAWIRDHTRLGMLARRWQEQQQREELQLRGIELSSAETWLTNRPPKAPDPSDDHRAFITESRRSATVRQRKIVAILGFAMLIALILSGLSVWQWQVAVSERNRALEGESKVIAQQARDTIDAGKVAEGIQSALRALPSAKNKVDRPYVAAAEAALIRGISRLREKSIYNVGRAGIDQVALSSSGKHLLTRSSWGEVMIWDTDAVKYSKTLHRPVREIRDGAEVPIFMAFDSTDQRVVVTSLDHTAYIWSLPTGSNLQLVGHNGAVRHAAFSPDSKFVVTASDDSTVRVWSTVDGKLITTLKSHTDRVNHVEFDNDGKYLVTSSDDKTVRLWSAETWREVAEIKFQKAVNFSHFSPDGETLLVVSRTIVTDVGKMISRTSEAMGRAAGIYKASSGERISLLVGHTEDINDAEFSQDSRRILTVSGDGSARVWSSSNGALEGTYVDLPSEAYVTTHGLSAGGFIDGGQRLITASYDNQIRVWNLGGAKPAAVLSPHRDGVNGIAFSKDRLHFATASNDGTARLWSSDSPDDLSIIRSNDPRYRVISAMMDGRLEISSPSFPPSDSASVVMIEGSRAELSRFNSPQKLQTELSGHTGLISRVDFSADGKYLSTVCGSVAGTLGFGPRGKDYTARIWDAKNGSLVATLADHGGNVERAVFHPNSSFVATASHDGKARLWSLPDGKLKQVFDGGAGRLLDLAFSQDGNFIVTASRKGVGQVWRISDGKLIATLSGHRAAIEHIEYSPDGHHILSASRDGTARLWDAVSGANQKIFNSDADLNFATFLADGSRIATAIVDPGKYYGDGAFGSFIYERVASRELVIWDTASGERLQELTHGEPIEKLQILDAGQQIITMTSRISEPEFRLWKPFLSTRDVLESADAATPRQAFRPDQPAP